MAKKKIRGGKRKGAGRTKLNNVTYSGRFDKDVLKKNGIFTKDEKILNKEDLTEIINKALEK